MEHKAKNYVNENFPECTFFCIPFKYIFFFKSSFSLHFAIIVLHHKILQTETKNSTNQKTNVIMKTKSLKFKFQILALAALGLGILATSCNKDKVINPSETIVGLDDELYTTEVFDEITEIGDEAMDISETMESTQKSGVLFGYNRLSECVTVTKVITDSLITTTIDFGETNCLCNDGRERRGKIIMTHSGRYWDGTATINFAFVDFYVDENQLLGQKMVTQTINSGGNRESSISVEGTVILADGTGTISWTAERVKTIVVGSLTRTKRDDVTETAGGSTCTLADGTLITSTITSPLVRKNDEGCFKYIVQGIREIVIGDKSAITVDYGDGECDDLAEVTINGVTKIVELKRRRPGDI